ncbi:MAG: hypothetical protein WD733_20375 [Bryobacterales bacterium]
MSRFPIWMCVFLLLWAAPAFSQPEASVRVAEELAPPGGLALIQIELTEPVPILTGDVTVARNGNVLGDMCGIGLFSSTLDVIGAGTRQGAQTRVRFVGFSGQVGVTPDLPMMAFAFEVSPQAGLGAQGSLDIIESSLRLEAPGGTIYRNDLKAGTVTVGGISITEVIPSNGIIPAGSRITFRGVGFQPDSRIDIEGADLNSFQVASATEIFAIAGQTFRIENRRIRLRNDDGAQDIFYTFTTAKLEPATTNPVLRTAIPILSPNAVSQALLTASPDLLGLTVRNPNATAASVRVRAFSAGGTVLADRTVSIEANAQNTLTPSEWLNGANLSEASTYAVESEQPVQSLGLRLEDGAFAPVLLREGPPPVEQPPANPRISQGGWVLATLSPAQNGIAPLAITTLFGEGFAPAGFSQAVGPNDITGGSLPTQLGGACVEIDGQRSPLFYVSDKQINLQATYVGPGAAFAVVVRGCGTAEESRSPAEVVAVAARMPALFVLRLDGASGVNPVAALHGGGPQIAGDPQQVAGATPARPGEFVSVFATGLGATDPPLLAGAIPAETVPDGLARVTGPVVVRIGNREVPSDDVFYAGAAPCCAGLYQVVFRVLPDLTSGQYPVEVSVDGVSSPPGPYLAVQNP